METRPKCTLPDGRQNPEYTRWYVKKNRLKIKERRQKYFQEHKHEPRFKEYRRKSKRKHRVALRRKGREYYRSNKERTLQRQKAQRSQPHAKKYYQKYHADLNRKHNMNNSRTYQKARIMRHKGKKKKRKPGFVYFFKSITPGYYKAGCTICWKKRKRAYSGPAAVERLYFLRPVRDKFYAETQLKIFLENAGYKPVGKSNRARICDWFVREEEKVF